ncbi:MAG: histidine phosphatase family protein [Butyrivibrio sp.]|uniref:histidine phosphatase family protein n=1 Tax=Butyrivibrio sp. TaxID=28121 RepID=UPI0025F021F5|nr:histidine phosphatase family protein [Butyrivibrio sp.]MCR5771543.1 histidine phosphatase family protein [Butyrivibrio sp.]
MSKYYFIRHGETDFTEADTKIYQGWGFNMLTLSRKGISQIRDAANDQRLKDAQIIVTSPYGRTMHTAAILSKELGIDMVVETDLHEWVADADYNYLPEKEAMTSFRDFSENKGIMNADCKYNWETAASIFKRTKSVLEKYSNYDAVIIVCHGTVMQYFLGVEHPNNGQIEEYML